MSSTAHKIVDTLLAAFGPQKWWPAETPFEVCVGAILTQNTAWKNVEKAIANLKAAGAMSPAAIVALGGRLEVLVKPAGTFRVKAARLYRFCKWIVDEHGGSLDCLFDRGAESLRETLLEVSGIGPETADAIALYAAGKETFVADSYTHRILARHGWIEWESGYDDVRGWWMDGLPRDAALFNEAHALLVKTAKEFCKTKPDCDGCPLKPMLPGGGVREREKW
ncbi:MAG: endonuclease III domain-containing protein [Planctomycetes bacterium]|nr:endonuclease III domain-containing protein [Planctomycetota bacterium]